MGYTRFLDRRCLPSCIVLALMTACGGDQAPRLVLGTTHTLDDSGLLDVLTRAYGEEHGSDHRLVVVVAGSGEILEMAARGDVDVALSHAPDAEIALLAAGRAEFRRPVMHNHFVLLGPPADPARASSVGSAAAAFRRIEAAAQPFVSRADDSGTHHTERAVWADAGISPAWSGYMEAGMGMADALRLASQRAAYILSDRATYEMLRQDLRLEIVHEDENRLVNEYSVLVVANAANADGARHFADWLASGRAQALVAGYRAPQGGRPLFVPGPRPGGGLPDEGPGPRHADRSLDGLRCGAAPHDCD